LTDIQCLLLCPSSA